MTHNIPIAKPFLDFNEEEAVLEVLRSGWISQGPKVIEFEEKLAHFLEVKYGRAINSGTSAIHLALIALGIKPGDEVIVPAFTCVATLNPLESIGARPIIVDIEIENFGMDPNKIKHVITPRTKAIICVHLFGLAASIKPIVEIAKAHELSVIEDTALGLGACVGGKKAGSFGDASCLSFHPRKLITTGEGGLVLTNSKETADIISELRNYGASTQSWERHKSCLFSLPKYETAGFNYKLTDVQAAIGLKQLEKLNKILRLRRKIAKQYNQYLSDVPLLEIPKEPPGQTHSYQSYVCLIRKISGVDLNATDALRLKFLEHLSEYGIACVQGAQAMPTISYYQQKYGWKPEDFPNAYRADRASLALPIYPGMTDEEQERVIQAIRSFNY
jgi:dTDP-4-amino-4,6-dideoxygalactose transaminase